nr:MAG TPA: hypothetical protein [Bacteriophage sp.]
MMTMLLMIIVMEISTMLILSREAQLSGWFILGIRMVH